MFARGDVITERRTGAVLVPREALVRTGSLAEGDQRIRVFTVENNVAREHQVKPGLPSEDGRTVEAPGIPAGAQVIVSGQRAIQNGDRVTLMRSSEPERSAQAL
jgi:multidrug efflux pump subunit AcrA (membrane-fusion protein)